MKNSVLFLGNSRTPSPNIFLGEIAKSISAGIATFVISNDDRFSDEVVGCLPPTRSEDLVLIDASDYNRQCNLDIFATTGDGERTDVVDSLTGFLIDFINPKSDIKEDCELFIRNSLAVLVLQNDPALCDLGLIWSDSRVLVYHLKAANSPALIEYWEHMLSKEGQLKMNNLKSACTHIKGLFENQILSNMTGFGNNKLSFVSILEEKKLLVINIRASSMSSSESDFLTSILCMKLRMAGNRTSNKEVHAYAYRYPASSILKLFKSTKIWEMPFDISVSGFFSNESERGNDAALDFSKIIEVDQDTKAPSVLASIFITNLKKLSVLKFTNPRPLAIATRRDHEHRLALMAAGKKESLIKRKKDLN